jgi:hypothetical protein
MRVIEAVLNCISGNRLFKDQHTVPLCYLSQCEFNEAVILQSLKEPGWSSSLLCTLNNAQWTVSCLECPGR